MGKRELKQYRVEVLEKTSHGRHGKHMFFPLALYGFNMYDAESVAIEMLAGMTFNEFTSYVSYKGKDICWEPILEDNKHNLNNMIGFELVEKYFSFRVFLDFWLD